ncbi:MAG TPA: nuclease [Myxococcota bacterium]|nr:nuclease [Myxococcota bacterium]
MLLLIACTAKTPPEPAPQTAPEPEAEAVAAGPTTTERWPSVVDLDGEPVLASWDDGDTFSSPREDQDPMRARLSGYNTLESYGPVHRWGDWDAAELYLLSKEAGQLAGSKVWECYDTGHGGGYGRSQVDCPELRQELLRRGLAHSFVMDGEALPDDLAAQQEAIRSGAGMWARGTPEWLTTSIHSKGEGKDRTYNRVVSTADGHSEERTHEETYEPCSEVCPVDSCMIYVPYAQRYGDDRAVCLR